MSKAKVLVKEYDYEDYGSFRQAIASASHSTSKHWARAAGFGNRCLRYLKDAARDRPGIELGCENDEFIRALMDDGISHVGGVEPSTTCTPVVAPELIANQRADAYLESQAPASVGAGSALDVFEHVPPSGLLRLIVLVGAELMPGGRVVMRTPNMSSLLSTTKLFGDLTHGSACTETSIRQLVLGTAHG